jgi:catalase
MRLSKARVFKAGRLPVIGRFSLSGGNPYVAETPDTVRGLGLSFRLPDGEEWRTAMINLPVFVVNTPQAFYDRLITTQPDP